MEIIYYKKSDQTINLIFISPNLNYMKNFIKLSVLFCLSINYSFSQTYSEEFLDGTIMFQLKENVLSFDKTIQPDENILSKNENISNYPEIAVIFNDVEVTTFERPSYFSNKRGIQTIFRVVFSDFDKIDLLISQLELLSFVLKLLY